MAVSKGHADVTIILLNAKANIKAKTKVSKRIVLWACIHLRFFVFVCVCVYELFLILPSYCHVGIM